MRFSLLGGLAVLLSLPLSVLSTATSSSLKYTSADDARVQKEPKFSPPQVYQHTNLLRSIDITKPYLREVIAAIVENTSDKPQSEYYLPVPKQDVDKISYIEARDRKGDLGEFEVKRVDFNEREETQYFQIAFPKPLAPNTPLTLQISIAEIHTHRPDPVSIAQADKQYLSFKRSQYASVAYPTLKQKTKITAPNTDIPDYTQYEGLEVSKSGAVLTYGPFNDVKAGVLGPDLIIRHEYTQPVIHMAKLERDIEVSHWGGNLAIEDRYWMENSGAKLDGHFSRVKWVQSQYYKPPSAAIKMLTVPLLVGAKDVYFTDEIGNVSTSRYRSNFRESTLELRPRFPIFGGWNYSFTIGYNYELPNFLKKTNLPDTYVLKVPLFEGPSDSTVYEDVTVRVVLPEGATGVKFESPVAVESAEVGLHKTFMDTVGRTTLVLKVKNVVDEKKRENLYVTYQYTLQAQLRKPLVYTTGFFTVFIVTWLLSKIDLNLGN